MGFKKRINGKEEVFYSQAHYDWWNRMRYADWHRMMAARANRTWRERWGRQFRENDRTWNIPARGWNERAAARRIENAWTRARERRRARLTRRYQSALDWVLKGYPG